MRRLPAAMRGRAAAPQRAARGVATRAIAVGEKLPDAKFRWVVVKKGGRRWWSGVRMKWAGMQRSCGGGRARHASKIKRRDQTHTSNT